MTDLSHARLTVEVVVEGDPTGAPGGAPEMEEEAEAMARNVWRRRPRRTVVEGCAGHLR